MAFPSEHEIAQQLEPIATSENVILEKVTVNRAGKKTAVVVVVDAEEQQQLDGVERLTRLFSQALDDAEDAGTLHCGQQEYSLEVTTRGVDAPLEHPRHWTHNRRRLVHVTTASDEFDARIGALTDDDSAVVLIVDGTPRRVALSDVKKAVVQIEFSSPDPDEIRLAEMTPDQAL